MRSTYPQDISISVLDRVEDLEAISRSWDDLVQRADGTPFMLSSPITTSWRQSGTDGLCVLARRGNELVGGLPLVVHRRLGAREGVLLCRDRCDVVCDQREPETTGSALLRSTDELPVDWIPVRRVMPNSALARAAPAGCLRPQLSYVLRMEMPEGWAMAYRERLSSKHRNTDRRKLRRLHELGEVKFDVTTSGEPLQRALEQAFVVHRKRWRDRPGENIGFDASRGWPATAARMGADGHVQLVTLLVNGAAAAFTYSYLLHDTMWLHVLAFDPALGDYSPGWLTLLHALGAASDVGVRRVDFGIGQEHYKAKLATSTTQLLWGTAVNRGARGALAARLDESRFRARQRAKQSALVMEARDRLFYLRRRLRAAR